MKDVTQASIDKAISKAGIAIAQLNLANTDTDQFFRERELVIVSAMESIGIFRGEPLFNIVRSEFEERLKSSLTKGG